MKDGYKNAFDMCTTLKELYSDFPCNNKNDITNDLSVRRWVCDICGFENDRT